MLKNLKEEVVEINPFLTTYLHKKCVKFIELKKRKGNCLLMQIEWEIDKNRQTFTHKKNTKQHFYNIIDL